MLKYFGVGVFAVLLMLADAFALNLQGGVPVNITSDTAANAKNIAFDEARRQIISDSVRQYVDVDALRGLMATATASDLVPMIASSSIDDERVSDTTYSANISMVLDVDSVRDWLNQNGVQNWLPDDTRQEMFLVNVVLTNPMLDWIELNSVARKEQLDLGTKHINGNVITLELPVSKRGGFTIALREGGWRYADNDGVLRVWK